MFTTSLVLERPSWQSHLLRPFKQLMTQSIQEFETSFKFFHKYLKGRIFKAILLSSLVAVLDVFGISMFIPLLRTVSAESSVEGGGKLQFVLNGLNQLGITPNVINLLLIICTFFILKALVSFLRGAHLVNLHQFLLKKLRFELVKGVSQMSFLHFVKTDVGRIQNTLSSEISRIVKANKTFLGTMEQGIMVVVYAAFAFAVDPRFAIVVLIIGLLTALLYNGVYGATKRASNKVTKVSHVFHGLLVQFTSFMKYFRITGTLDAYEKKLNDSITEVEEGNRKIGIWNALVLATREPLVILALSAVIFIQYSVLNAAIGPILLSLVFFYRAMGSLAGAQAEYSSYTTVAGSVENMISFVEEVEENTQVRDLGFTYRGLNHNIQLENLHFAYNDENVLSGINLTINARCTTAIVGESGSGKSTLLNVISGLFPVKSGEMSFDSVDASLFDVQSRQQKIGFVTQDPVVFNDSIFNNVTLWAKPTDRNVERFWEVLKKVAMFEFVKVLDQKEQSLLGHSGINISGGEKQRLAIARELFKDIDLLFLDEATSALDSETEQVIQESIEKLKGHYTIVMVSHRLSSVRNADNIVLLKNGEIEIEGSFQQLFQSSSTFKKMATLQGLES